MILLVHPPVHLLTPSGPLLTGLSAAVKYLDNLSQHASSFPPAAAKPSCGRVKGELVRWTQVQQFECPAVGLLGNSGTGES